MTEGFSLVERKSIRRVIPYVRISKNTSAYFYIIIFNFGYLQARLKQWCLFLIYVLVANKSGQKPTKVLLDIIKQVIAVAVD